MTSLTKALNNWQLADLPREFGESKRDIPSVLMFIRQKLAVTDDTARRSRLQAAAVEWLYRLVRRNVKRGRIFALDEVLAAGRADCLGYTKLFAALGEKLGLKLGIVEVLVDNRGRYVPHYANLLQLADGTYRFIDAWYGSTGIKHRRIGALVAGKPEDINREELDSIKRLEGLPARCLEAIDLYIRGNRSLALGKPEEAVKDYSRAIELYPENSRAYYNRAVAYERINQPAEAKQDYARAFRNESGLIRVLANAGELEPLIQMDEAGISEEKQKIYLWHQGFRTGVPVSNEEISRESGLPVASVKKIIAEVESHAVAN